MNKTALVYGGGGFIGSHLVKRLKEEGYWVRAVDLKQTEFWDTFADDFIVGDLRDPNVVESTMKAPNQKDENDKERSFDEVYQLAADMGGAGFVFTGENDADIMHNSALININATYYGTKYGIKKIFYSSSACMYPEYNQMDPNSSDLTEDMAYPAAPDSEYGWEKLFSERLFFAFHKNYGLNVRVARFHNIFGPYGTWDGGREKAPAAMCRKIAQIEDGGTIEIWGDGEQTRSFLYVDECVEAVLRLMKSDFIGPVNIGSDEMVTINQLASYVAEISGKKVNFKHIPGPLGVRGRNSENSLIKEKLGWEPNYKLKDGLNPTYAWILQQVQQQRK